MELSDAIKAGAKLRPQVFNGTYGTAADGSLGTCALGAAYESVGFITFMTEADGRVQVSRHAEVPGFPLLRERTDELLPCGCEIVPIRHRIDDIIVHLNDKHHWPREHIASWVRRIERK